MVLGLEKRIVTATIGGFRRSNTRWNGIDTTFDFYETRKGERIVIIIDANGNFHRLTLKPKTRIIAKKGRYLKFTYVINGETKKYQSLFTVSDIDRPSSDR